MQDERLHQDATNYYICGNETLKICAKSKLIGKLEIIFIISKNVVGQHIILVVSDLMCSTKFFHNAPKYNYHFIIKGLSNEFEGQFEKIEKNREKF